MTKIEEILVKWEKAQVAYETWLETIDRKWKNGETIHNQLKDIFKQAVDDLKELSLLESPTPPQPKDEGYWQRRCEAAEKADSQIEKDDTTAGDRCGM